MPSHPDRVRRNYHTIKVDDYDILATNSMRVTVEISKIALATTISKREASLFFIREVHSKFLQRFNK